MTPERAEAVAEAVKWLLAQGGADLTLAVSRAPLANGQTVAITVRAYVPDSAQPWQQLGELL